MFKCSHCKATFQSAIKFKKHGRNPCQSHRPPLANVQSQLQTPSLTAQTQQVPYVLMPLTAMAQPMSIIQSQIPNAPPTLVVDTSPQAMETEGFLPPSEMKPRSILKNSNSPSRFSRPVQKPNFTINKLDSNNYEGAPATSDRKIIITKEGQ
jgi:hypothetical protein